MNFSERKLSMLEIRELSSSDILTPSHRFRCALDCINISIAESIKICEQIGKRNNDPFYDEASFIDEICIPTNNHVLAIGDENVSFGALHYEVVNRDGVRYVHIHHIGVYPQYRRRGYATALFRYMFEHVNADKYQIGLMADNTIARKLYESLGFKVHSLFMFRKGE